MCEPRGEPIDARNVEIADGFARDRCRQVARGTGEPVERPVQPSREFPNERVVVERYDRDGDNRTGGRSLA